MHILNIRAVFCNRMVCQMRVIIISICIIVIMSWESYVWLFEVPNSEGVPICHQHPHSQVELSILDDHWVLNILLADKLELFLFSNLNNLHKILHQTNAPAS
jgi:hypothetical protein